ncbi:glutaredoxin family protein [Aliidiomarina sp. Khilg15.8]
MRVLVRYFFRGLRVVLTPVMLISETLSTPKRMQRPQGEQAKVDAACKDLALYQFRACPFCIKVRKEMARLNLNIDVRDAQLVAEHREALQAGGGRVKVPCLRIEHDNGETEWMYESDDIIAWLRKKFDPAVTA